MKYLYFSDAEQEEPCEGRLSSTVLWEGRGETPLPDPIGGKFKAQQNEKNLFKKNKNSDIGDGILKTMDDYKIGFDLDSKIASNRHRLRELFEQYKKIENFYPLFLVYLGGIAIYYFDFLPFLSSENCFFYVVTILTGISVLYSTFLMAKVFFKKKWNNDYLPKDVYDLQNNVKNAYPNETDEQVIKRTKEIYLTELEKWNSENFTVYSNKKNNLTTLIKVILISLLLYSINIGIFKFIKMGEDKKETKTVVVPPPRQTNEGNKGKNDKPLITEQGGQKQTKNVLNYDEFIEENKDSLRKFIRTEIQEFLKEQGKK